MANRNNQILLKLLQPGSSKSRMYLSWLALCLGIILLLLALVAWIDFSSMLADKADKDSMAEYLVIGKQIGQQNSGRNVKENFFRESEITNLENFKGVDAVGKLISNHFPVSATIGGSMGLTTELFLEAVDDQFLDAVPEDDWHWQKSDNTVPIIMSTEFLNLYNYGFALSQGLPQLSQKTIKNLPFMITINGSQNYRAQIVGFTDRISSLLVPKPFMDSMNAQFSGSPESPSSRLILKVKDPSAKSFVHYLEQHHYTVNQNQLRWSRIRTVVQVIVSSVGVVALIIVGMSLLVFVLFVEIVIQRAAKHINLLLQLGYQSRYLSKVLIRYFLPWIFSAVIVALGITIAIHFLFIQWIGTMQLSIAAEAMIPLIIAVGVLLILLTLLMKFNINRLLSKVK